MSLKRPPSQAVCNNLNELLCAYDNGVVHASKHDNETRHLHLLCQGYPLPIPSDSLNHPALSLA